MWLVKVFLRRDKSGDDQARNDNPRQKQDTDQVTDFQVRQQQACKHYRKGHTCEPEKELKLFKFFIWHELYSGVKSNFPFGWTVPASKHVPLMEHNRHHPCEWIISLAPVNQHPDRMPLKKPQVWGALQNASLMFRNSQNRVLASPSVTLRLCFPLSNGKKRYSFLRLIKCTPP